MVLKRWFNHDSAPPDENTDTEANGSHLESYWNDFNSRRRWPGTDVNGDVSTGADTGLASWTTPDMPIFRQVEDQAGDTVTGTTAQTAFASVATIPRNYSGPRDNALSYLGGLRVSAGGVYSTTGSGNTVTLDLLVGTDAGFNTGAVALGNDSTNVPWHFYGYLMGGSPGGSNSRINPAGYLVGSGVFMFEDVSVPVVYDSQGSDSATYFETSKTLGLRVTPSATTQSHTQDFLSVNFAHPMGWRT